MHPIQLSIGGSLQRLWQIMHSAVCCHHWRSQLLVLFFPPVFLAREFCFSFGLTFLLRLVVFDFIYYSVCFLLGDEASIAELSALYFRTLHAWNVRPWVARTIQRVISLPQQVQNAGEQDRCLFLAM
jgi:hypothetical protein